MLRFCKSNITFFLFSFAIFAIFHLSNANANAPLPKTVMVEIDKTATLNFPQVTSYRRTVLNAKTYKEEVQVFRICNGKNKGKCGFWENTKTKKKVASGATSYNKTKKALIIKKFQHRDEGVYSAGTNKKKSYQVYSYGGSSGGGGGGGGHGVIVGEEYEWNG